MEQEIMQNANFEWLATLFVGIFSAFAGTFLGAVLLNHLQKSNMRKNRGTAVKAYLYKFRQAINSILKTSNLQILQ